MNKEKGVFLVCLLIFVGTIYFSLAALGEVSSDKPEFPTIVSSGTSHVPGSPDEWEWFEIAVKRDSRSDPFQTISKWSGANPDPMPLPPRASLARRVPLPGTLATSVMARPATERTPPTPKGEEEETDDE